MSHYTLSLLAEEDLIQIYIQSVETFGFSQASDYHQKLSKTIRFLATNPLAALIRPELQGEVRIHPVASHIVLYTVRQQDILVLRIRHAREDWLNA